jgi:hypothetical protein
VWVVRGQYPSGDVVEEFDNEQEAERAKERHLAQGVPVAVRSPAPAGVEVPGRCSFCGRDREAVERLIAGPQGVAICDQCVALCNEILAPRR